MKICCMQGFFEQSQKEKLQVSYNVFNFVRPANLETFPSRAL